VSAQSLITQGLVAAFLLGTPALAQDHGDAKRGSVLALGTCAVCHSVSKNGSSTNPSAPPFRTIAETKGMSEMALSVSLQTPHRAMPNIMLDPQERADVIAYILSLKGD
jgi:mono/diheme cytochrome c family protein